MSQNINNTDTVTAPDGRRYKEVPVRNACPIWAAAAVWGIAMLVFPMYKIFFVVLTAALSVLAGVLTAKFMPKETRRVEIPFSSGNADLDTTVKELDRVSSVITANSTGAEMISAAAAQEMKDIAAAIGRIRAEIIKSPEKIAKLRKFFNYYLPTTEKLTGKYAELAAAGHTGTAGENINETLSSIEGILGQIRTAFDKQYDALFADVAMDITTDVTVLETKIKMDHLD